MGKTVYEAKKPEKMKTIIAPSYVLKGFGLGPLFDAVENKMLEKLGGSWDEALLTPEGKKAKAQALELKKFIEASPMPDERLANEFIGHAIAFGAGKIWLKRLGGKNAELSQFLEKMECPSDTLMRFIDLDSYWKEFQAPQ
ncbi:MAG: hypothetical protein V1493_04685 [Candidatus Diapherotrites archaeon]